MAMAPALGDKPPGLLASNKLHRKDVAQRHADLVARRSVGLLPPDEWRVAGQKFLLETERQTVAGRFAERRRESRRQADQRRLDHQIGIALVDAHFAPVGRHAGQVRQQRGIRLLAQLRNVDRTSGGNQHPAVFLQPTPDLEWSAQEAGIDFRYAQITAGKLHASIHLLDGGQSGIDRHFIVFVKRYAPSIFESPSLASSSGIAKARSRWPVPLARMSSVK